MSKWIGRNVICVKESDRVKKNYNNRESYENELKWVKLLPDDITPVLISFNDEKLEIIESYCGLKASFIKLPEDYLTQLNNIKSSMKKYNCDGCDCEIVCNESGKIKIIDFSGFSEGEFSWGRYKKVIDNGQIKHKTKKT